MKRLFKTFFNRFALLAIMVILQVVFIYLFFFILDENYNIARFVMLIISWLFLISLFFRSMPQEGKLTWAILILGLQPLGVILYIMFSKNLTSLRQKKLHDKLMVRNNMYNFKDTDYEEDMREVVPPKYYGQMEYIYFANKQFGFVNTKTKYFPSGETYFKDLVEDLKKAKKFIFLEYFIIEPGEFFDTILEILKQKISEGVEVRLIYDDIGSMTKLPLRYASKLRKLGIKVVIFNRFIPIVSAVHNNRTHRKIFIIDGKVGYTGGVNLADEYINVTHPFGYWKDTGLRIEGQAVDELTLMFLADYDLQTRKIDDNIDIYLEQYEPQKEEHGVIVPYGDGPRPAYLEYVGENVYINLINSAERKCYITTPYLICDSKLMGAIQNAASRGVDVRIITPHIPDKKLIWRVTRSNYAKLQKYGVKIYEYEKGFIHAKQVLVDDECSVIGTINFDYRSLLHHYENAVWMYKTKAIDEMKEDFDKMFEESIDMKDFKQNVIVHILLRVVEMFQVML